MGRIYKDERVDFQALKKLKVLSEENKEIPISLFWYDDSVVFIFVRHFGCVACRTHVQSVWQQRTKLKEAGSRIVFIGSGSSDAIRSFKDDLAIPDAPIYTDPSLKTFDACGMKRSLMNLLDPRGAKNMLKLLAQGHRQKMASNTGYHTQMGGVVLVKSPGRVTYHFISDYLGDEDPGLLGD